MHYKTSRYDQKPIQFEPEHRKVKTAWTLSKTVDRWPEHRIDIDSYNKN